MFRLNSGNRNRHNFFILAILTLKKTPTDSVNHADSGDINILVQFPGNSDNKDIEDVRALIQESKEIEKLAPPMIAFRATGTMTTQAADPGKSDHVMCFSYSRSLYVVYS